MKNYRIAAVALVALALSSCAGKARIDGVLTGTSGKEVVVKQLNINTFNVLDTVKTAEDGSFSYKLDVKKGQPEFIYLFYGDTRVAALLLESGEKAKLEADTLGVYKVSGSAGSEKLMQVEDAYASFIKQMASTEDSRVLGQAYLNHYRASVKYVMENPFSMTVIPVLMETVNNLPVFAQPTDALHFRCAADSLKTVYPESALVKALDKEAQRRESELKVNTMLRSSVAKSFPSIEASDINGEKAALDDVDAKVVLVHFWDASDAAQKMLNIEALKPLYEEFHKDGLEIYSVCLDVDKVEWAGVVKAQELPWINVNDGLGVASPAVTLYNVSQLPATFVIAGGEILPEGFSGTSGLRALLKKLL